MTMAELERIYKLYYPEFSSPTKRDVYNYLLQQGRSNRKEIASGIDTPLSPYMIGQIESMVEQNILTKIGNKPMYYEVTYVPMEAM